MVDKSFSSMLRALVNDYYNQNIDFDDYRAKRKEIFDQIEREYNVVKNNVIETDEGSADRNDNEQDLMQTISFFSREKRNVDSEEQN